MNRLDLCLSRNKQSLVEFSRHFLDVYFVKIAGCINKSNKYIIELKNESDH
jgi:hypothetical protein